MRVAAWTMASVMMLAGMASKVDERPWSEGQQRVGERLRYVMDGRNRDGVQTTTYRSEADGVVKKNDIGALVDEFRWTRFTFGGTAFPLSPPVCLCGRSFQPIQRFGFRFQI